VNAPVTITDVASVKWKLANILEAEGINPYKLAVEVKHSRANTVYRLARKGEELKRVDLEVLADVLSGLRKLTGKDIKLTDLLDYSDETN